MSLIRLEIRLKPKPRPVGDRLVSNELMYKLRLLGRLLPNIVKPEPGLVVDGFPIATTEMLMGVHGYIVVRGVERDVSFPITQQLGSLREAIAGDHLRKTWMRFHFIERVDGFTPGSFLWRVRVDTLPVPPGALGKLRREGRRIVSIVSRAGR